MSRGPLRMVQPLRRTASETLWIVRNSVKHTANRRLLTFYSFKAENPHLCCSRFPENTDGKCGDFPQPPHNRSGTLGCTFCSTRSPCKTTSCPEAVSPYPAPRILWPSRSVDARAKQPFKFATWKMCFRNIPPQSIHRDIFPRMCRWGERFCRRSTVRDPPQNSHPGIGCGNKKTRRHLYTTDLNWSISESSLNSRYVLYNLGPWGYLTLRFWQYWLFQHACWLFSIKAQPGKMYFEHMAQ